MYRREKKTLTCIQGKYLTFPNWKEKKLKKIHLGDYPSSKIFQTIEASISSVKLDFYTMYGDIGQILWWHCDKKKRWHGKYFFLNRIPCSWFHTYIMDTVTNVRHLSASAVDLFEYDTVSSDCFMVHYLNIQFRLIVTWYSLRWWLHIYMLNLKHNALHNFCVYF